MSFSFLQAKLPLTITSGQRDRSSHTNTIVGSARPKLAPLCKIGKSVDDRNRTYLQVTQKHEATEELKARRLPLP